MTHIHDKNSETLKKETFEFLEKTKILFLVHERAKEAERQMMEDLVKWIFMENPFNAEMRSRSLPGEIDGGQFISENLVYSTYGQKGGTE